MLITNFAAGELSKKLSGRVDLNMYYAGAQRVSNFNIIPTGGIERRTGLKREGKLHGKGKLIPFIINKDLNFILEATTHTAIDPETEEEGTTGVIYIWRNGKPATKEDGSQIMFTTDYTSLSEVLEMQYAQNYNEIVLVHKNHKPLILKYDYESGFTFSPMAFDLYADVNLDDDYDFIVICEDDEEPTVTVTGGIPYIGDKAYPQGLYVLIKSKLEKYNVELEDWEVVGEDPDVDWKLFQENGKYPGAVAYFNNRLYFAGTKLNPQKVWASCTPDTAGSRYNKFATYQKYVTVEKVLKEEDVHIFSGNIALKDITQTGQTTIRGVTQDLTGIEDITKYYISSDVTPVGAKVISVTADTVVIDKPAAIAEDKETLTFTIQLWKTYNSASAEDYEFEVVNQNITTSDCSFNFELASSENDAIKWLAPNKSMTIGTESTVWEVPGGVSALNIQAIINGRFGSDNIQALTIDTAVVFFAQGCRGIREHYYNAGTEGFVTNNIALMAEHMLEESPAIDLDYCCNPFNRLYIVREDGQVVTMLYDKNNAIQAWSRIIIGEGKAVSCAVVGGTAQNDIVYFAVQRGTDFYLESMDSNYKIYLDGWTLYSEDDYEEGMTIYDIESHEELPADEAEEKNTVYMGWKYESDIVSMPLQSDDPTGKKRIVNLLIRFLNSHFPVLKIENQDDEVFSDTEPFSGVKNINYPGYSDRDVAFELVTDKCESVTILSINAVIA